MLKQILQIKPGEQENEPVGLTENLKEDMNKKKKKRNKEKSRVIEEDKAEPYVCSICSVICDSPAMFESHLNGRKHAATIEKHAESLLGDKQIPDDVIQYNNHLIDGEAPEEAREWIDAIFNTPELSQDANLTQEFERILNQSLEMNSGGYEGVTEHPEEFKDKVSKDKSESEAYVCSICSVVCACPTVFESHLLGRRHAAKVLFDDKEILEESLKEKDRPEDSMVKRLEVSLEDTSKQTVVEAGSASERVDVTCSSKIDFNSHLTGKKHAATVKKYEPVVKKEGAVVKKQAGTKFAYVMHHKRVCQRCRRNEKVLSSFVLTCSKSETRVKAPEEHMEKAKQDDGLSDLSDLLGELKNMAVDMGSEIGRQKDGLDYLHDDVDELNYRVQQSNQRASRLLRK
ncbi:hypothetical protein F2Q69_00025202 [Brassica cretica]|uniref:t-SNARE coiled-coil homology domain-containing protein n=1 Tax=Brassica cretica TaxID=69181 RepID=A0A8S9QKR2_BRACR|nr:hypothetical protein F2Q69_00025202 [Brassica cretica]